MSMRLAGLIGCLMLVAVGVTVQLEGDQGYPQAQNAGRPPRTYPDYDKVTIPCNIAPLNMVVLEQAERFHFRISGKQGKAIVKVSGRGVIRIPSRPWRQLLEANRGQQIRIEILVRSGGRWSSFEPLELTVADAPIDRYIVYRAMHPTHQHVASPMKIICRDLSTFTQWPIMDGSMLDNACINCHSFPANRPEQMLLGVRSNRYGVATLVSGPAGIQKIGAKFGYTAWHPDGQLAVYSINNLPMFYHAARQEPRDTVDLDSMIAYYRPESGQAGPIPALAEKTELETWPAWSADGRYLYYCTARKAWPDKTEVPPPGYDQLMYDLMRIYYDPNIDTWGKPEVILTAKDLGRSIGIPRCSPNGRWVSFCGFGYGFFPAWQDDSDIYLLDVSSGKHRLLIADPKAQSWHSWSSNSRFLVFSSKAVDGPFTRIR
ncbi:MAG: hypothetical protein QHH07_12065, partial [Sedimentisphaerales bacterium]|nr:hypothetical protein [Sedimentisphaerales bacterium]